MSDRFPTPAIVRFESLMRLSYFKMSDWRIPFGTVDLPPYERWLEQARRAERFRFELQRIMFGNYP